MQSRVVTTATRLPWFLSLAHNQGLHSGLSYARSAGRIADPDIHSGEVEAGPDVYCRKNEGQGSVVDDDADRQELEHKARKETGPLKPPRTTFASSPRLESTEVSPQPPDPVVQQKSNHATTSVEGASCEGLDGTPWPEDKEDKGQRDGKEQVEDDTEYFTHHKASPLSEIKVVDTRKPLMRATDGTADAGKDNDHGADVIGWRPEQLDTAEEALRRAVEIWRQNAVRGDPETYPHSRVLRELRGEWF